MPPEDWARLAFRPDLPMSSTVQMQACHLGRAGAARDGNGSGIARSHAAPVIQRKQVNIAIRREDTIDIGMIGFDTEGDENERQRIRDWIVSHAHGMELVLLERELRAIREPSEFERELLCLISEHGAGGARAAYEGHRRTGRWLDTDSLGGMLGVLREQRGLSEDEQDVAERIEADRELHEPCKAHAGEIWRVMTQRDYREIAVELGLEQLMDEVGKLSYQGSKGATSKFRACMVLYGGAEFLRERLASIEDVYERKLVIGALGDISRDDEIRAIEDNDIRTYGENLDRLYDFCRQGVMMIRAGQEGGLSPVEIAGYLFNNSKSYKRMDDFAAIMITAMTSGGGTGSTDVSTSYVMKSLTRHREEQATAVEDFVQCRARWQAAKEALEGAGEQEKSQREQALRSAQDDVVDSMGLLLYPLSRLPVINENVIRSLEPVVLESYEGIIDDEIFELYMSETFG